MELKEIKAFVEEILQAIENSKHGYTYRNFEAFVTGAGKKTPANVELIKKFDYQFKKHDLSLHCGREQRRSLLEFNRGEKVTFRRSENAHVKSPKESIAKISYQHAGTIHVSSEESGINLYKHQEEAVDKLQSMVILSNKRSYSGLLVLPTGGGKTLTAAYWIAKNFIDKGKKVLWVAHRHELLEQAQRTFHEQLSYKDIFANKTTFNYRLISGIHDKPVNVKSSDDIIICSKDSLNAGFDHLHNKWLKGRTEELFLVIDEAHHATARSYRKLIKKLREKVGEFRTLGLTATPFRTAINEQGLLAKVFPDDIVYKVDLRTLIARGILSEPIFEEVTTGVDLTPGFTEEELTGLNYFDIASIGKDIAQTIGENSERNWSIVNRYTSNRQKYGQTIIFALNIANAIALNKLLQEQGVRSDFVISDLRDSFTGARLKKNNSEIIARFRSGELEVLVNVNILTEGTDVPNVRSVFLARPTISPVLMTQMIGRGLRGEKAGGTKDAYIVSFVDDWRNKVAWVNPERLLIEENVDFTDEKVNSSRQLLRLVALGKMEEFASLANKSITSDVREELEQLDFIARVPVGIYHFSILQEFQGEAREKNCEILVYDNVFQSYRDFICGLSFLFEKERLVEEDNLNEDDLDTLVEKVEVGFFYGCSKYPAYYVSDIRDVLQFYAQNGVEPKFVELADRTKYDLSRIAEVIIGENKTWREIDEYKSQVWDSNETEWKAFFGYDKRYFLNEIDLALRRLSNPELYKRKVAIAVDVKEQRDPKQLSMFELKEYDPMSWKQLSDAVYSKFRDDDGNYFSATGEYSSKNKLDFQIDHIVSLHNGGFTELDNLQLLTRHENALKGTS